MRSLAVLLLCLAPSSAFAKRVFVPNGLTFTLRASGGALDLTFANDLRAPVTFPVRVHAGRTNWDNLSVTLVATDTQVARTLPLSEARDKSGPLETETLAPTAKLVEHVDLVPWAFTAGNGEPLAPGSYHAVVTWNGAGPAAHLVANTDVVIPAPTDGPCSAKPDASANIELLARQIGETPVIEVGLYNSGSAATCVASRVQVGVDVQSDWLTFTAGARVIALDGTRKKSNLITSQLAPGATSWTRFDVDAWARRPRNGGKPLTRDTAMLRVTYDSSREHDVWAGVAHTEVGVRLR